MKIKKIFIIAVLIALAYFSFGEDYGKIYGVSPVKRIFKDNSGEGHIVYCYNIPKEKLDEAWDKTSLPTGVFDKKLDRLSPGFGFISYLLPTLQKLMFEYNLLIVPYKYGENRLFGRSGRNLDIFLVNNVKDGDGEVTLHMCFQR